MAGNGGVAVVAACSKKLDLAAIHIRVLEHLISNKPNFTVSPNFTLIGIVLAVILSNPIKLTN